MWRACFGPCQRACTYTDAAEEPELLKVDDARLQEKATASNAAETCCARTHGRNSAARKALCACRSQNEAIQRETLILDATPACFTIVSLDGRQALHQNITSKRWMGDRVRSAPTHRPRTNAVSGRGSWRVGGSRQRAASSLAEVRSGDMAAEDEDVLELIFQHDTDALERMLRDLVKEGDVWKAVVRVPLFIVNPESRAGASVPSQEIAVPSSCYDDTGAVTPAQSQAVDPRSADGEGCTPQQTGLMRKLFQHVSRGSSSVLEHFLFRESTSWSIAAERERAKDRSRNEAHANPGGRNVGPPDQSGVGFGSEPGPPRSAAQVSSRLQKELRLSDMMMTMLIEEGQPQQLPLKPPSVSVGGPRGPQPFIPNAVVGPLAGSTANSFTEGRGGPGMIGSSLNSFTAVGASCSPVHGSRADTTAVAVTLNRQGPSGVVCGPPTSGNGCDSFTVLSAPRQASTTETLSASRGRDTNPLSTSTLTISLTRRAGLTSAPYMDDPAVQEGAGDMQCSVGRQSRRGKLRRVVSCYEPHPPGRGPGTPDDGSPHSQPHPKVEITVSPLRPMSQVDSQMRHSMGARDTAVFNTTTMPVVSYGTASARLLTFAAHLKSAPFAAQMLAGRPHSAAAASSAGIGGANAGGDPLNATTASSTTSAAAAAAAAGDCDGAGAPSPTRTVSVPSLEAMAMGASSLPLRGAMTPGQWPRSAVSRFLTSGSDAPRAGAGSPPRGEEISIEPNGSTHRREEDSNSSFLLLPGSSAGRLLQTCSSVAQPCGSSANTLRLEPWYRPAVPPVDLRKGLGSSAMRPSESSASFSHTANASVVCAAAAAAGGSMANTGIMLSGTGTWTNSPHGSVRPTSSQRPSSTLFSSSYAPTHTGKASMLGTSSLRPSVHQPRVTVRVDCPSTDDPTSSTEATVKLKGPAEEVQQGASARRAGAEALLVTGGSAEGSTNGRLAAASAAAAAAAADAGRGGGIDTSSAGAASLLQGGGSRGVATLPCARLQFSDAMPIAEEGTGSKPRVVDGVLGLLRQALSSRDCGRGNSVDECWHEIWATRAVDPVTQQDVVVVVQHDVTNKMIAERHLALVMETEHRLLEQLFPRHILAYITEEFVAKVAAAAASGNSALSTADAQWRPAVRDCKALATWHPQVTLLFADIKGFTPMCKEVEPPAVMAMLNDLYSRYDQMLDQYGVFKVETIGDCYFVAGGLIHEDEDGMAAVRCEGIREDPLHALKVFDFARAMLAAAEEVLMPTTHEPVQIRIGIHSGPVVSGVVGTRMPRFCLFGDTVNTTSRMESTGASGAIHASEATYELLKDSAHWTPTGGIQVKGKGLLQTYIHVPRQDSITAPNLHLGLLPTAGASIGSAEDLSKTMAVMSVDSKVCSTGDLQTDPCTTCMDLVTAANTVAGAAPSASTSKAPATARECPQNLFGECETITPMDAQRRASFDGFPRAQPYSGESSSTPPVTTRVGTVRAAGGRLVEAALAMMQAEGYLGDPDGMVLRVSPVSGAQSRMDCP